MKKLVLATILAVAGLTVSDAFAGCGYYGNCGKQNVCASRCEDACAPKLPCCAKYKVIDEACECPPECERFVRVTEPAICIRSCRWVCPEGTALTGSQVAGKFELVGGKTQHDGK
jgi:hypothetical protein